MSLEHNLIPSSAMLSVFPDISEAVTNMSHNYDSWCDIRYAELNEAPSDTVTERDTKVSELRKKQSEFSQKVKTALESASS